MSPRENITEGSVDKVDGPSDDYIVVEADEIGN